jgi:RHH-type transcriptional regulator, proline utilization regulon repressor / proline dehydrogenase / delta 1-pyrroline-5-carboxylate dehydrogenase
MTDEELTDEVERRALALLEAAEADTKTKERAQARRLARLLDDDAGRDLLLDLTDQVLRIRDAKRAARRLHDLTKAGVPASLGTFDRTGLVALGTIAPAIPNIAERAVDWRIDKDTSGVILPAEPEPFNAYVRQRTQEGFRLNINVLGEAILGDDEAEERCRKVLERITSPNVDYVSVKISAICANLDVLAETDSLQRVAERLRPLYRAAKEHGTFINLDMEEYRDLELSLRTFMDILSESEFTDLPAGIVLQAYIPDSHAAAERLIEWANARVAGGGAPIKIRIVKGANLAMEQVEAEMHDWQQAPFTSKVDVDASYKMLLETILMNADPRAVRIGVASHNLFEIAWALTMRDRYQAGDRIEIEMLEGMAPPQARAVRDAAGGLLLYAPVVEKVDRDASIAYLSRRLDENSSPENFLKSLFDITPGSPAWELEAERFRASVARRHTLSTASNRQQDRSQSQPPTDPEAPFHNAIETDFTSAANRAWIEQALVQTDEPQWQLIEDQATVDTLIEQAVTAQSIWASTPWAQRRAMLAQVSDVMEREAAQTMAIMAKTTGKTIHEGDPEVAEAVDFVRYAAHLTKTHQEFEAQGATWQPHRVVVVAGPWNFPYAIPTSGIAHAVAAGAAVIMKPAPEARAVAAQIVQQFHAAGIPEHLVQLACTPDNEVGQHLITHDDVDLVMLTGSYLTADLFTGWKPGINVMAETSGKNALIITAAADIDQAIKDLVRSAFGHAGQKCSAASLAIVEASVYDDPSFHRRLSDAVRSLHVGDATDPATKVGPVINPPSGPLQRALTSLEPGEQWLVEPRVRNDAGTLWSPGVRTGVSPNSWFHLTECFGPVLGIMRADDLQHAITLQNATEYGLTGGIHSLDPKEIHAWLERVQVGNAYINRHITGAIVQRQPFGGWKRSSIGAGRKPGGPGHLHSYGSWQQPLHEGEARASLSRAWQEYYSKEHDPSGLRSERNVLRYLPLTKVIVRYDGDETTRSVLQTAADLTGVPVQWSNVRTDSEADLIKDLQRQSPDTRLRLLTDASADLLIAAHQGGVGIDRAPVTNIGMIELGHWLKEQAISQTMHRYGRMINDA